MENEENMSVSAHRKNEHIEAAQQLYHGNDSNDFDAIHLIRPALPQTSIKETNISTHFFGYQVSSPFFINAMTGGTEKTAQINSNIARAAQENKIAMALGSASLVEREPERIAYFEKVRADFDGPLLVNVNPTTSVKTVQFLIQALNPTALQIHVNAVQEVVMNEGDRDFRWLENIKNIRESIDIPVIVKEVGCGFDPDSMQLLAQNGIQWVDVAGAGGTNFAQIENYRTGRQHRAFFENLGLSTVKSLMSARHSVPSMNIIGSGGIRNPLDVMICMALGARYVGVSNRFLQVVMSEGQQALSDDIAQWIRDVKALTALYGIDDIAQAQSIKHYDDASIVNFSSQLNRDFSA